MNQDIQINTHKDGTKNKKIIKKKSSPSNKVKKINLKNLLGRTHIQRKVKLKYPSDNSKGSPNKKDEKIKKEPIKIQPGPLNKLLKGSVFKCTHIKTEKGQTFLTLQSLICGEDTGRTKLSVVLNGSNDVKKKKQEVKGNNKYILPLSDAVKTNSFQEFSEIGRDATNKGTKLQEIKKPNVVTNKTKQKIKINNKKVVRKVRQKLQK